MSNDRDSKFWEGKGEQVSSVRQVMPPILPTGFVAEAYVVNISISHLFAKWLLLMQLKGIILYCFGFIVLF